MLRLCANKVKAFDVDDTLISQDPSKQLTIAVKCFSQIQMVAVNQEVVEIIKKEYSKGTMIIVWSQQGDEWADAVVRSIGLENHVHYTMTKISEAYDDLPIKEWMKLTKIKF